MPRIKTNDILTYYEVHRKGKPIVFIHGAESTYDAWKPQVKYFSKKYMVVTYDIMGH